MHIWLNDVDMPQPRREKCEPFSYTDSEAKVRWTPASLVVFVRELKAAHIKPIFTLSPQIQKGIDVELDLEEHWRDDKLLLACGAVPAKTISQELVSAIKDSAEPPATRQPLRLIISTTTDRARFYPVLFAAADVFAPQLYEGTFMHPAKAMLRELAKTWMPLHKPLIAALNIECTKPNQDRGVCSEAIFSAALACVAALAQPGASGAIIPSYVLWSEGSGFTNSLFGRPYIIKTANKPIATDCKELQH